MAPVDIRSAAAIEESGARQAAFLELLGVIERCPREDDGTVDAILEAAKDEIHILFEEGVDWANEPMADISISREKMDAIFDKVISEYEGG